MRSSPARSAAGVGDDGDHRHRISEFERVRAIAERYPTTSTARSASTRTRRPASRRRRSTAWSSWRGIPKVVGIGETGLDFYYDHSPRDRQARGLPRPHRSRPRDRAAAHRPQPRRRRGDGRAARRGRCRRARSPASSIASAPTRQLADRSAEIGLLHLALRHPDVQEGRRSCARSRGSCRSTACWSRPTRRTWRRCRIAASATSRPSSRTPRSHLAELRGMAPADLAAADHRELLPPVHQGEAGGQPA